MRLLTLEIHEPLPGNVLPHVAEEFGAEEAARRYRAIVITTLRQLRGLVETRLRIVPRPVDADEALRFWLLPRLADRWQADGAVFRADGWEVDFGGADPENHQVIARGEILCPFLGSRWVHTAMLGLERGTHRVIGPATSGGEYFHAHSIAPIGPLEDRLLPELPVIRNSAQWDEALASPLGPALKKAWEEEA